jgi:hypothetical protein
LILFYFDDACPRTDEDEMPLRRAVSILCLVDEKMKTQISCDLLTHINVKHPYIPIDRPRLVLATFESGECGDEAYLIRVLDEFREGMKLGVVRREGEDMVLAPSSYDDESKLKRLSMELATVGNQIKIQRELKVKIAVKTGWDRNLNGTSEALVETVRVGGPSLFMVP